MSEQEFENIEVNLTLTVPSDMNPVSKERLHDQLLAYGHTLPGVIEAGIRRIEIPLDQLVMLWNEVANAAPIVYSMAPADYVWGGMTCTEAETIAGVWAAAGHKQVAAFIIDQHGLGDDDPEDTHHETFIAAQKEEQSNGND